MVRHDESAPLADDGARFESSNDVQEERVIQRAK